MLISKTFVDFKHTFSTECVSVSSLFSQPGVGYYIPLYQREYSWDTDNVDQLMDDLCEGVETLLDREDSILFMGTIILLPEAYPKLKLQPKDDRAIPSHVEYVIDGQQRISTFALLATLLQERLRVVSTTLQKATQSSALDSDQTQQIQQVQQEIETNRTRLLNIFSVDLQRGKPERKPVILRGSVDGWTLDGLDDDNYKSPVARHLAHVISSLNAGTTFPLPLDAPIVKQNLRRMNEHLDSVVEAHKRDSDKYSPAWRILANLPEEAVWTYAKPNLTLMIVASSPPLTPLQDALCATFQILAFVNFLLKRCCVTVIKPTAESWAFDMFQSLNATGTPLTAVETFKPMVSNYGDQNGGYRNSPSEKHFAEVDAYLGQAKTANQKSRLTNDFLTTFALIQDGTKLPSQFSSQRRYLEREYDSSGTAIEKEEFVRRFAELAQYRRLVVDATPTIDGRIAGTEGVQDSEREIATLCHAYIKKANHKMADTILSRFYGKVLRSDDAGKVATATEFVGVCKSLAAFFTLWRSATSNSNLDDAYRRILRGSDGLSWEGNPANLTLPYLKTRLRDALKDLLIDTKTAWINRAITELRYKNNVDQVCRFALLVTAGDTIPDPNLPGLMIKGQPGVQTYLRLEKWLSPDLSTIEHIAPQSRKCPPWDVAIYEDDCVDWVGNLTLLPLEINSSAGNKGWQEKWLYYRYLIVQNPVTERPQIEQYAQNAQIVLDTAATDRLEAATHKAHIRPLVEVGIGGIWNRCLIEDRSKRICDLLWDKIYPWLM